MLGASFGGDLLSPGAQDVQALAGVTGVAAADLGARIIPASLAGLLAAVVAFSLQHRPPRATEDDRGTAAMPPIEPVHLLMAAVPLVPVALLLLAHAGWGPVAWLVRIPEGDRRPDLASALPVVRAMLIGSALAAVAGWRRLPLVTRGLFDGMGAAYRDIISLTITAQCFGAGVAAVGLGDALLGLFGGSRWTLAALSVGFPWGLAALSGSGSGPVLAFAEACLVPLRGRGGVAALGALTCLSAAFGRTMSPVSAVVLCGSGLAGTSPLDLVRSLCPRCWSGRSSRWASSSSGDEPHPPEFAAPVLPRDAGPRACVDRASRVLSILNEASTIATWRRFTASSYNVIHGATAEASLINEALRFEQPCPILL